MLIHLVFKELSDHLKTLRFMLMFSLVTVLLAVSAVFYLPGYHERMADFDRNNSAMLEQIAERATWSSAIFAVFSYNYNGAWVFECPNRLGFISDGAEQELPNSFRPSAFRVYGPAKQVRSNILLGGHQALDWSLIIGLVLSFFALVMVFDSVCGERESGTLRLNLSHSVSRACLLVSKFLGGFIAIAAALSVGVLVHLIILLTFGSVAFEARDWLVVGGAYGLSLLYVAVFLMLGLLISALTRESSSSLVLALISWALLVIVIPGSGAYLATRLTETKPPDQVHQAAEQAEEQALSSYNEQHPALKAVGISGHWSPGEPLGRALVIGDAWTAVMNEYRNGMVRQVDLARKLTLVSPYACYALSLERLTESGVTHYQEFLEQIQAYRLTLRQYLLDIYPLPLDWYGWDDPEASKKLQGPLDFNSLPKFQERLSAAPVLVHKVLPFTVLLVLFNVILFAGAFVAFVRYDVR